MGKKIVCDRSKCSGCLACIVACIDQHAESSSEKGISCRIYEKHTSPTGLCIYKTRNCLHCDDPACVKVCPVGALYKDERGFVIPVKEKCIGCKACARACAYDVPRFDENGKIVKCDGCSVRIAHGLLPACVSICNTGALELEDK